MVVAAPLLVAARPGPVLLWGLPKTSRMVVAKLAQSPTTFGAWRLSTDLFSATALHGVLLWAWHLPKLFEWAATNEFVHILQHLCFTGSAILFWEAVSDRDRRRYGEGAAALALFFTSLHAGALGALMAFSQRLWYPAGPDPWPICGLTRIDDQALAGLIMGVGACSIYALGALLVLGRWFIRLEKRHAS
jgi:putative membrane protein